MKEAQPDADSDAETGIDDAFRSSSVLQERHPSADVIHHRPRALTQRLGGLPAGERNQGHEPSGSLRRLRSDPRFESGSGSSVRETVTDAAGSLDLGGRFSLLLDAHLFFSVFFGSFEALNSFRLRPRQAQLRQLFGPKMIRAMTNDDELGHAEETWEHSFLKTAAAVAIIERGRAGQPAARDQAEKPAEVVADAILIC
jgi:hypothetical protein